MRRFRRQLTEAIATLGSTGIGAPPTDTGDDGGADWQWEPDRNTIAIVYKWVQENFKLIARPVHDALEQVPPQVEVYPIKVERGERGSPLVWGSATLRAQWVLTDMGGLMSLLQPVMLRTDLLARLRIPYEHGFALLQDALFLNYFIRAIQQVLNTDQHAPYWLFERQSELEHAVQDEILDHLTQSGARHEVSELRLQQWGKPRLGLARDHDIGHHLTHQDQGPVRLESDPLQLTVAAALGYSFSARVIVPGHTQAPTTVAILGAVHTLLDQVWEELTDVLEVDAQYDGQATDPVCEPTEYRFLTAAGPVFQEVVQDYEITPEILEQTVSQLAPGVWRTVHQEYQADTQIQVGRNDYQDIQVPVRLRVRQARLTQNQLVLLLDIEV